MDLNRARQSVTGACRPVASAIKTNCGNGTAVLRDKPVLLPAYFAAGRATFVSPCCNRPKFW